MLWPIVSALALVTPALRGPRQALLYCEDGAHPLAIKAAMVCLAKETRGGAAATAVEAAEMETLACMLEARNPTPEPAGSALLNGAWDQIYTSNTVGITFGDGRSMRRKLLGPLDGRVTQLVDQSRALYRQRIEAPPYVRGELRAKFAVSGPQTWAVSFRRFTLKALLWLPVRWRRAEYEGSWTHTYLDGNTRLMRTRRAGGGGEFLFVLRRR